MDQLVAALAPAFAAGFAIQRVLELLDSFAVGPLERPELKKVVAGVLSLALGVCLAAFGNLRVLAPLGAHVPAPLDYVAAGLIISGGTEGFNSILKFLGYAKQDKKANAAERTIAADGRMRAVDPRSRPSVPTSG